MQIEQLNLSPKIAKAPPAPPAFTSFATPFAFSPSDAPLSSSCRRFAFSLSLSETSDSIARILSTSPPAETAGLAAAAERSEQSGQHQLAASARVLGRVVRQETCHGVAHVLHVRISPSCGFCLQTMHRPSPSQGRSLSCAIGDR